MSVVYLSLFLIGIWGIGALFSRLTNLQISKIEMLGIGILLNQIFAIMLPLKFSLMWFFIGSLGLYFLKIKSTSFKFSFLTSTMFIFYTHQILFQPIDEWDPRSIWFFHSKIIFYSGHFLEIAQAISTNIGLISHFDYPKLVPLMGAQIATMNGFWNEFLPKFSLMPLFIYTFGSLLKIFPHKYGQLATSLFFLLFGKFIWNGYMDAYLALLTGILIFRVCFLEKFSFIEIIIPGILCISLKNEGIIIFFLSTLFLLFKKNIFLNKVILRHVLTSLLLILGPLTWLVLKKTLHLSAAQITFDRELFIRIQDRLPQIGVILYEMLFVKYLIPYFLFSITTVLAIILFKNYKKEKILGIEFLIFSKIYGMIIFIIYMQTLSPLKWHLNTSLNRTMLPIYSCLMFFIMVNIFYSNSLQRALGKEVPTLYPS